MFAALRALLLSLAIHAMFIGVVLAAGRFSWPQKPIPIEIQTPKPRQAARKPAPPPPPPASGVPRKKGPGPAAAKAPPLPPAPAQNELKNFAPSDATIVVMVRVDKVLASPHRDGLEYLCNILPDFRMLIGPSGARIEDFIAVVIATNDPRDIAATFVAARYKESPRIHAIADQPLTTGDPRVFKFLKPGLGALVRPDDAAKLEAEDSDRKEWLAQLEKLDQKANTTPGLVATVADVPSLVRLGDGLPTPQTLALAATFEDAPAVRVRAHFGSEADAEKMARAWPEIVRRYRTATAFVGLAAMLDGLSPEQHGADLEVAGRLPAGTVRLALQLARAFVPPPRNALPGPAYAPPDGGL